MTHCLTTNTPWPSNQPFGLSNADFSTYNLSVASTHRLTDVTILYDDKLNKRKTILNLWRNKIKYCQQPITIILIIIVFNNLNLAFLYVVICFVYISAHCLVYISLHCFALYKWTHRLYAGHLHDEFDIESNTCLLLLHVCITFKAHIESSIVIYFWMILYSFFFVK